ncbi:MAG: transcription termination factor Rho, partial [Actinobacteria bacterium]|nr:transcription termination factor Rho [Actinomycetota bacterium]
MTEKEPIRSDSPELTAMSLPKLKEVASQLGIDGAAKLKKDALVQAIADLQAANRDAAKAEREARREARNNRNKKDAPRDSDSN